MQLVRLTDARYVTLLDPFSGLWGIQALYNESGERVSDVAYYRKLRAITVQSFTQFFLMIWDAAIHGPSMDTLSDAAEAFDDVL